MPTEFGKYIAEKRLEKDVKLRPIAERLGVSVTYLSDIIKGRRNPPEKEGLEKIAETLGLSQEEKDELVKKSTEYYNKNAKPGSMMAKANMVRQYNEKNNKK